MVMAKVFSVQLTDAEVAAAATDAVEVVAMVVVMVAIRRQKMCDEEYACSTDALS